MSLDTPLNGAADWTEAVPLEPIAPEEVRRLAGLERTIELGMETFVQVGSALAEVRERRLYRGTHPSFQAYCDARWGLSRKRAYDLMAAAEVVEQMSPMGDTLPTNERQARALAAAPPEERADVMAQAVASAPKGKPTAKAIEAAIDARHPKSRPEPTTEAGRCTECGWSLPVICPTAPLCLACAEAAPTPAPPPLPAPGAAAEEPRPPQPRPRPRPPTIEERADREAQERRESQTATVAAGLGGLHACLMVPQGAEKIVAGWQPQIARHHVLLFPQLLTPDGIRGVARMLDRLADVWAAGKEKAA